MEVTSTPSLFLNESAKRWLYWAPHALAIMHAASRFASLSRRAADGVGRS